MGYDGNEKANEHLYMRLREFDKFFLDKDLSMNYIK